MSRLLLHPLVKDAGVTRAPAGEWHEIKLPDELTKVDLRQAEDRAKRGRISSIPNPWARVQLFRDAIVDQGHPFHEDALNDILDSMEIVLFQAFIFGVSLRSRTISIDNLHDCAAASRSRGVGRFVTALRDLAPVVERQPRTTLTDVTVVFNGLAQDGPILFAFSPFTLFFTPEAQHASVPGYYGGSRPLRPLAERPVLLGQYVRDRLIPQLDASSLGALTELQELKSLLKAQLADVDLPSEPLAYAETQMEPVPGVVLHRLAQASLGSTLSLQPTRLAPSGGDIPLVLDNSGRSSQDLYFPWLPRPRGTVAEAQSDRQVLPGTAWKQPWIFPESDFLSEELLIVDAPFHADRVYGAALEGDPALASRILLPLKERFFDFFRAQDVPGMLTCKILSGGDRPQVRFTLAVPTRGGTVAVQRTYDGFTGATSHLSLWPGFKPEGSAAGWSDFYLIHYLEGGDAGEEFDVDIGAGGERVTAQSIRRDQSTVLYHFGRPAEAIRLRSRHFRSQAAEGVVLPRLRSVPEPTFPAWTVAIDFGTSNTVVAHVDPQDSAPRPLQVSHATRFDLTGGDEAESAGTYFDTFFFPAELKGEPFSTVIFKSRGAGPESPLADLPAFTANIPFSGEIGGDGGQQQNNVLVGDLKWGGGGADTRRLTRLFLHQILQVVHAEALARGARTEEMEFRVSYPIAFSRNRRASTRQEWEVAIRSFRAKGQPGGSTPALPLRYLDESTASMLFFGSDPASRSSFSVEAKTMKLTADVGGGTTDITAFAKGGPVLRMSMLFGGRDLIAGDGAEPSIYGRLQSWAERNGLRGAPLNVLRRYPTEHTRFTYLVRQPWFAEHCGALAGEPWFMSVQACIAYFYSAILYNVGLRLRSLEPSQGSPPDALFFAGNGASYLNWLTQFEHWNQSPLSKPYTRLFQRVLEAGYGQPLPGDLKISSSSKPKQEVVLGLLRDDPFSADDDIPSFQPVGEDVSVPGQDGGETRSLTAPEMLDASALSREQVIELSYSQPFGEWEISRFNTAFVDALEELNKVDKKWGTLAGRVRSALAECTEVFFDNQVKRRLAADIAAQELDTVSIFGVEAAASLRQLERSLVD
ncbi:MAG TPA: hypothetical protein VF647_11795 [Longimicrobium sp.]|jgi:hypothetical protein